MNLRYGLVIIVTLALMFLFYKKDHVATREGRDDISETGPTVSSKLSQKSPTTTQIKSGATQTVPVQANSSATTPEQVEKIQKNFAAQLRQMGQCLASSVQVEGEKLDPQIDNLTASLAPSFGNMLVKMDDWTQWDGRLSDGSVKRIRTETEYLDNNVPTKRLQIYKMNEQGMPMLQPVSDDVAVNPTDEYLESLHADASTVNDEKASRAYFAEGEELVVVERNGKLLSFSMSKGEKTFTCNEMDVVGSSCQCL